MKTQADLEVNSPDQLFVEETFKNADDPFKTTYSVVYLADSFEDGRDYIRSAKTKNRLELWSQNWTNTGFGYAPMFWKN